MKRVMSKRQLVLLFSFAIFTAHTLAAEPPEAVKSVFLAHRQRQREARLNFARPSPKAPNLQSHARRTLNGLESKPDDTSNDANTQTSNWSGAVQTSPSGKFNSVSAQWLLPAYSSPPFSPQVGTWYAAELVGIDGYGSCVGVSLQAGVFGFQEITSAGAVSSGSIAWYEWYPGGQTEILPFDVPAGDFVQVTVTANSLTQGTVVVDNLSTGVTVSRSVSPPAPSNTLCGMTAEWVVEDMTDANGNLDPFARFDDVHFQDVKATTNDGGGANLNGATMLDITQNNVLMASATLLTTDELVVTFHSPTS